MNCSNDYEGTETGQVTLCMSHKVPAIAKHITLYVQKFKCPMALFFQPQGQKAYKCVFYFGLVLMEGSSMSSDGLVTFTSEIYIEVTVSDELPWVTFHS